MKFTLSLAVLALAASQAMAVVPTPIKECTKTVIVQPTDTGCAAFAAANGCTFEQMLEWNLKLRTDCLNLDVGHPICVSVTPGGPATAPVAVPTTVGKPVASTTTAAGATESATATTSGDVKATTSAASASTSASAPAGNKSTTAATSSPTTTKPQPENAANGNKASLAIGAAGALLSALYML